MANKIAAYNLQQKGYDTVDANHMLGFKDDYRTYKCVKDILNDLKIKSVKLLTNNPRKIQQLEKYNISITQRIPLIANSPYCDKYLQTKVKKMGHVM